MVMFIFKLFLVILMARKIVKKLFVEYKKNTLSCYCLYLLSTPNHTEGENEIDIETSK